MMNFDPLGNEQKWLWDLLWKKIASWQIQTAYGT